MAITNEWRGEFTNAEVNALHAEGFDHAASGHDWNRPATSAGLIDPRLHPSMEPPVTPGRRRDM